MTILPRIVLVSAALFTGAALYVTFVEHPVRLGMTDAAMLAQWQPSYERALPLQAALAILAGVAGLAAWYPIGDWQFVAAGLVMLANWPFTLLAIMPTTSDCRLWCHRVQARRAAPCCSVGAACTTSGARLEASRLRCWGCPQLDALSRQRASSGAGHARSGANSSACRATSYIAADARRAFISSNRLVTSRRVAAIPSVRPVLSWNGRMVNSTEIRVPSLRSAGTASTSPAP